MTGCFKLDMLSFRCSHKEECQELIQNFECKHILGPDLILVSQLILGSQLILVSNLILESDLISALNLFGKKTFNSTLL